MPKKPAKTAFYLFALDFKAAQEKRGFHMTMQAVVEAASSEWMLAPPSVRSKYEERAKAEKNKNNVPERKYTSYGVPISDIIRQEKEEKKREEKERKEIRNLFASNISGGVTNIDIYLMDVNYYCKIKNDYIIGESTMLRFTLEDGLDEVYHEIINPGTIPMGYAYNIKVGSEEFGLQPPDETKEPSNYMQILANIIEYLKKSNPDVNVLPPIFVMPDKVEAVRNFLNQMCLKAGEDETIFRVYRLDLLLYNLANAAQTNNKEIPTEAIALSMLKRDLFLYTPQIGCEHHNEIDMTWECTKSRVTRQAFTIMDQCCSAFKIEVKLGKHLPADLDLDLIMDIKEKKVASDNTKLPTVQGLSISADTSSNSIDPNLPGPSTSGISQTRRVATPLRRPDINEVAARIAIPQLDEDFPPLGGMGRGRKPSSVNKESKFK